MTCDSPGCDCKNCKECDRPSYRCICDLRRRTDELLNADAYTYEDAFHRARSLLQEWYSKE